MRLTNFVLDTQKVAAPSGSDEFKADATDPATRQTKDDIYPWGGDVKYPYHVFQGATRIFDGNDSDHINFALEGSNTGINIINNNSTLKLTGSLAAIPMAGSQYTWGILMVADSETKG